MKMKRTDKLDARINIALRVSPAQYAKELRAKGKDHAKKVANDTFVSLVAVKDRPETQRSYKFWREVLNIVKKES